MAVHRTTFKEQVYDHVFSDVLDGNFPLGQFITEKQLMERYQVGKAPVREALIELCNENVLRSIPRLGYQVMPVTERDILDATELRLVLELGALEKTSRNFSGGMLTQVSRLNQDWWQEVISGEVDIKKRWQHNSRFHATLCSFAGNELAVEVVRKMIQLEWRAYAQMLATPEQRSEFFQASTSKPHIEIERALTCGDFHTAQELLRGDIMTLPNWLLTQTKRLF